MGRLIGSIALIGSVAILQTILPGVRPDIVLIVLIFFANRNGRLLGQLAGMASGLIEDLMSLSPFGFHALTRIIIGFVYGLFQGKTIMGPVVESIMLVGTGILCKALLFVVLGLLFSIGGLVRSVFSLRFLLEIGLTLACAPLLYLLLRRMVWLQPVQRTTPV